MDNKIMLNERTIKKFSLLVIEACSKAGEGVLAEKLLARMNVGRLVVLTNRPPLQH